MPLTAARKSVTHLADGRELIYFDPQDGPDPGARTAYPDTRSPEPRPGPVSPGSTRSPANG